MAVAVERLAVPAVHAQLDYEALRSAVDAQGDRVFSEDNIKSLASGIQQQMRALRSVNKSVLVTPSAKFIEIAPLLGAKIDAAMFERVIAIHEHRMTRAYLAQILDLGVTNSGSRSVGEVQERSAERFATNALEWLRDTLRPTMGRLTWYNFGDVAPADMPTLVFSGIQTPEFVRHLQSLPALGRTGSHRADARGGPGDAPEAGAAGAPRSRTRAPVSLLRRPHHRRVRAGRVAMPIYELTESIRDNLRRGLRLHEDGKSGDGLTPKTVREAREGIRDGWDLDKLNRAVAWFARHESSKTPGWDEVGDESPAFVAWLLWGGDPDAVERIRDRARRAEGVDEVRSGPSTSEAMGPEAPAELAADAATLRLYGAIGDYDSSMAAVVGMLDEVDGQDLLVRIASMGGDAFEGIAIANAIMQRKGRTVARIESVAASAASLIAMAADRIEMVEGSLMMIHSASGMVHGEANDMRTAADAIERLNASAAAIYARRSGMTPDEALAAMGRTTWYTADEAVAARLADAVVRIPMESDAAGAVLFGVGGVEHPAGRTDQDRSLRRRHDRPRGAESEGDDGGQDHDHRRGPRQAPGAF